jgi:hypothetical protein
MPDVGRADDADDAALLIRLLQFAPHFYIRYFQLGAYVVRVSICLHLKTNRSELASVTPD